MDGLAGLGLSVRIHERPNELPDPIPFAEDERHASYDPEYAHRFWRTLVSSHRVFTWFRAGFRGKASPVHLFWGSFDLAVTRFSGRRAPLHPGGVPFLPDRVAREAYSHEVSSAGFWAGNEMVPYPAFYAYAYPDARRLRRRRDRAGRGYVECRARGVSAGLRSGTYCARSGRRAAPLPPDDLRGGRRPRRLEPRGAGLRPRAADRCGVGMTS